MQAIICKLVQCGFNSSNGFCLKRTIAINENGVCSYLTNPHWQRQVEQWQKYNYRQKPPDIEKQEIEEKEQAAVE